jgi:membrane protease YdiL (CAAX protease family)
MFGCAVFRSLRAGRIAIGFWPGVLTALGSLGIGLFAGIHGDAVLFPTLAGLGFVWALSYAATGNLAVPIVLHAANNAVGALALIAGSFAR